MKRKSIPREKFQKEADRYKRLEDRRVVYTPTEHEKRVPRELWNKGIIGNSGFIPLELKQDARLFADYLLRKINQGAKLKKDKKMAVTAFPDQVSSHGGDRFRDASNTAIVKNKYV